MCHSTKTTLTAGTTAVDFVMKFDSSESHNILKVSQIINNENWNLKTTQ